MIAAGISPKLVAQRHGHSNVSITLGLYSHVQPATTSQRWMHSRPR